MASINDFGMLIRPWYGTHWVGNGGILRPPIRYKIVPTFIGIQDELNVYFQFCCGDLYNSELDADQKYPDFTGRHGKYFIMWVWDRENDKKRLFHCLEAICDKSYDMNITFAYSASSPPVKEVFLKNCRTDWYTFARHGEFKASADVIFEYDEANLLEHSREG